MAWIDETLQELEALHRDMDREFGSRRGGRRTSPFSWTSFLPGRRARAYPLVNLNEDSDAYYVEALAPGVDPESLNIAAAHNVLTISGEKAASVADVEPEAFHRNERAAGKFVRTLTLPDEVDDSKITADYSNGLLLVTLPKAEKAKPKKITVNVA